MDAISERLGRFIDGAMSRAITEALEEAMQDIEKDAKSKCPPEDRALRESIEYFVEQEGDCLIGHVGTSSGRAPYVHEGIQADRRPFLQEALDENMYNIMKRLEGCLKDVAK